MSYSSTQDAVLTYMRQHGAMPETLNGQRVRSTTREALARRGAIRQTNEGWTLTENGANRVATIAENLDAPRVNRMKNTSRFRWLSNRVTFDIGQADYLFWDMARRGAAEGLQIAGLLLKPIASKIAAWTLGDLPTVAIDDETRIDGMRLDEHVARWLSRHHAELVMLKEEAAALGDMYAVVNPDTSLVEIPPNVVELIVNEDDYSEELGWRVWQVYEHPTEIALRQTVMDEYTMAFRRRTVWRSYNTKTTDTFAMPLPTLPIIHIANERRANEKFGRSVGEALIHALHDYNAIFDAGADGVINMARPFIAFERMGSTDDIAQFYARYGVVSEFTNEDGTTETVEDLEMPSNKLVATTGSVSVVSAASGFTQDTARMLEIVYMLFVEHTELPEFILGTAIASSKASAEAQLPAFTKWIEKQQRMDSQWLRQMIRVYVATLTYTRLGRVIDVEDSLSMKWQPITNQDGQLTLAAIDKAMRLGVPDEYLVPHLPLDMDDQLADIQRDMAANRQARADALAGLDEPFVSDEGASIVNAFAETSADNAGVVPTHGASNKAPNPLETYVDELESTFA